MDKRSTDKTTYLFFKKEWYDKGIFYIRDILDTTRNVLSPSEIKRKFNLKIKDYLFYIALKLLVQRWVRDETNQTYLGPEYTIDLNNPLFKIGQYFININKAKSRDYYNVFLSEKCSKPSSLFFFSEMRG